MTMPRLTIVASAPPNETARYEGMDRPQLAPAPGIPEALVARVAALEDLRPDDALPELVAATAEVGDGYELLWLGDDAPAGWEPLGYDVGETTSAAWSAIRRWQQFLDPEGFDRWRPHLNQHGLLSKRATADAYLAAYLAADDPDRGWTADGWSQAPDLYQVVPVWRRPQG